MLAYRIMLKVMEERPKGGYMCEGVPTLAGYFPAGDDVGGNNLLGRASTFNLEHVITTATDKADTANGGLTDLDSIVCSATPQLSDQLLDFSRGQIAGGVFLYGKDRQHSSVVPLIPERSTGILFIGAAMAMLRMGRRVRLAEGGNMCVEGKGIGRKE